MGQNDSPLWFLDPFFIHQRLFCTWNTIYPYNNTMICKYYYIIKYAREGNIGNFHHVNPHSTEMKPWLSDFQRVTISDVTLLCMPYSLYHTDCYSKNLSILHLLSKQSWSHYYLNLAFHKRFIQTLKWHQLESTVNHKPINLALSIIFL